MATVRGSSTGGPPSGTSSPSRRDGARYWERWTGVLCCQLNAGWWLSTWLPWVLAVGIAGTFGLLWVRWQDEALVPNVWRGILAAFVATAAAAAWLARPRFESRSSARVLLEDALSLHTRLSAAAEGIGPWPAPRGDLALRWPVVWRWQRPVGTFALVATMLAAAAAVPMATAGGLARQTIEKPADAAVVERWNEALRREQAIDERSAAAIDERIEALLERPQGRWYEHASLEAASSLREQTAEDLQALAKNLAAAASAAARLSEATVAATPEQREAAAAALAEAAENLATGGLRPGATASAARSAGTLSRDDLRKLAAALRDNGQRLKTALAQAGGIELVFDPAGACEGCTACGTCAGCRAGGACEHACEECQAEQGAIQRGPGAKKNSFADRESRASARPERIGSTPDDARAAPGELLGVIDGGEPSEPEAYAGPQAGGGIAGGGTGGSSARIDEFLPDEQRSVRRFFKP